jgi:two-component system alkaline phosphatase synthesis response regulator PhoP
MKKILVFDDEEGILEAVKIVLTEKGYLVKGYLSFNNIFKIIDDFQPDLMIIDLWMPDFIGDKIIKKIKSNPDIKQIPIIVLSASNNTKEIALKYEANDYLLKPFDLHDLEIKVDMILKD